eukprot:1722344-Rhodomonas_salina.2
MWKFGDQDPRLPWDLDDAYVGQGQWSVQVEFHVQETQDVPFCSSHAATRTDLELQHVHVPLRWMTEARQ